MGTPNERSSRSKTAKQKTVQSQSEDKLVSPGQENQGRWTEEEHEAFLDGIKTYGREWKKVASRVRTRTVMQTRTHAQKYFDSVDKQATEEEKMEEKETNFRLTRHRTGKAVAATPEEPKRALRSRRSKFHKETHDDEEEEEVEEAEVAEGEDEEVEAKVMENNGDGVDEKEGEEGKVEATKGTEGAVSGKEKSEETSSSAPAKAAAAVATPAKPPVANSGTEKPAPEMMASPDVPGQHGYTDRDIVLPMNEIVATRAANKEYMELLKANCVIFHSLATPEQIWFVRNLWHFITHVRGRRWVGYHHWTGYRLLPDPLPAIAAELRMDPLKRAALMFHPFWLLGEHDPANVHGGAPFIHRKVDGNWKPAKISEVKDILAAEGPKNLLLLPAGVKFEDNPIPPEETVAAAAKTEDKAEGAGDDEEGGAAAAGDEKTEMEEAVAVKGEDEEDESFKKRSHDEAFALEEAEV